MKKVIEFGGFLFGAMALISTLCGLVYVRGANDESARHTISRVEKVEATVAEQGVSLNAMKTDVATIRNDVGWIRSELERKRP